jgi:hypothetical protein
LKSGGQKKNNKLEGERKKNPVKKKANDFSLLLSGMKHFRGERNNDQIAGSDLRKKKGRTLQPSMEACFSTTLFSNLFYNAE